MRGMKKKRKVVGVEIKRWKERQGERVKEGKRIEKIRARERESERKRER